MVSLSPSQYAVRLCEAVRAYDFPAVACRFERGGDGGDRIVREPDHGMDFVEKRVRDLLRSTNLRAVKDGLSNLLYWGYANSPGLQRHRVGKFRDAVEDDDPRLKEFVKLREQSSPSSPTLLNVRQLGLPQFSQMSFTSKVLMFLDPKTCPVLDLKIARTFARNAYFSPLENLTFGTSIPITRRNADAYRRWACWCSRIAEAVNKEPASPRRDLRAVDVERALFTLAGDTDDEDKAGTAYALLQGPEGWTFNG